MLQKEAKMKELTTRFVDERNGLENQLRRMRDRIGHLEHLIQDTEERNHHLLDETRRNIEENENLKQMVDEVERNSAQSINDLNDKLELQKNREIEELVKRSNNQHESVKRGFETDLITTQNKLESAQREITFLNEEVAKLTDLHRNAMIELDLQRESNNKLKIQYQTEVSSQKYQNDILIKKTQDYENQIHILNKEVVDLHNSVTQKIREVEDAKFSSKNSGAQWVIDKAMLEGQVGTLSEKVKDYEKRLGFLGDEISNLRMENITKTSQLEEFKATTNNYNSQWSVEKAMLENRINSLLEKSEMFESRNTMLAAEVERWMNVSASQNQEIEDYKKKLTLFERETQGVLDQLRVQLESKYKQERVIIFSLSLKHFLIRRNLS